VNQKRIYVFLAPEVGNRHVHIRTTSHSTGAWTTQHARNLLTDLAIAPPDSDSSSAPRSGLRPLACSASGMLSSCVPPQHS
jgi:hypothetical protein